MFIKKNKISFFIIIFLTNSFCLCQNNSGYNGFISIPGIKSGLDGSMTISGNYINKQSIKYLQGVYDVLSYSMMINYLNNLEILFRIVHPINSRIQTLGIGDRSFGFKYSIENNSDYLPSLCFGINDFVHLIDKDSTNSSFNYYFLLIGKQFNIYNVKSSLDINFGYATKYGKGIYSQFDGFIWGIKFNYKNYLSFMSEYDSRFINLGIQATCIKYFKILVALMNLRYFSGGLSISFML